MSGADKAVLDTESEDKVTLMSSNVPVKLVCQVFYVRVCERLPKPCTAVEKEGPPEQTVLYVNAE